jgi:hypothetical protein
MSPPLRSHRSLWLSDRQVSHSPNRWETAGEPLNVGDTKTAAIEYHDSGQYQHDLADVAAQAIAWIGTQVPEAPAPPSCSTSAKPRCRTGK